MGRGGLYLAHGLKSSTTTSTSVYQPVNSICMDIAEAVVLNTDDIRAHDPLIIANSVAG